MNEVIKLLGTGVLGGIIGGFVGAYCQHRFARSRESEAGISARRRAFRAFMFQLRSEVVDRYHLPTSFPEFWQNKIPNLQHEAATIVGDFDGDKRAEFQRLVAATSGFRGTAPDGSTKPIVEAIDAVIKFIDT